MTYERNRLQLYQQFPQLLLQLTQREEEEAQQLPDIVMSHLRILASSLRLVTCCCERFTIRTDCYELFTEKNQSVGNRKKIFDMSKNWRLLSQIPKSVCEL